MLAFGLICLILACVLQYLVVCAFVWRGRPVVMRWSWRDVVGYGIYYGAIIWIASAALQQLTEVPR